MLVGIHEYSVYRVLHRRLTTYEHHRTPCEMPGQVDIDRLTRYGIILLACRYITTCTDVDLFYLPVYKCTCATYLARYGIADGNAPLNLKWNCLSVRTLSFCLITWTFCEWAWSLPLIAITTIRPITLHPFFFFFLFTNHSQLSSFDDFKFLDSILMIANHHLTFWHLKNANKIRCAQNNVSLEWKFSNIFVFLFFYSIRKNLGREGSKERETSWFSRVSHEQ